LIFNISPTPVESFFRERDVASEILSWAVMPRIFLQDKHFLLRFLYQVENINHFSGHFYWMA
ncbi:hypothetical protein M8834_35050, partial [Pseudomonas aeruginosa]|uniref:hypothetical protein n=1 Tax=Pseudomonas aeruginosa TaxID=287 RepID=UPI00201FD449